MTGNSEEDGLGMWVRQLTLSCDGGCGREVFVIEREGTNGDSATKGGGRRIAREEGWTLGQFTNFCPDCVKPGSASKKYHH